MPKVRPLPGQTPQASPAEWREMETRIINQFGMMLTTAQLGRVIGLKNYDRIIAWAAEERLHPVPVGRRKKWDCREIAKALANAKARGCAV